MELAIIGVSHQTAPVDVRSVFAFTDSQKIDFMARIQNLGVSEAVVLSTCNRSEVYFAGDDLDKLIPLVKKELTAFFAAEDQEKYLSVHRGREAVRQLFRVASGLESMVIGEDQILGQVRQAYEFAAKMGATGKVLNKMFLEAVTLAKRIKRELKISQVPLSVSYIGIKALAEALGGLKGKKIALVGLGKMNLLSLKYLLDEGAGLIWLCNRDQGKALALARAELRPGVTIRLEESLDSPGCGCCGVKGFIPAAGVERQAAGAGEGSRARLQERTGEGPGEGPAEVMEPGPEAGALAERGAAEIRLAHFNQRYRLLAEADAVVTATASPHTIFRANELPTLNKPLLFLDIALPRDVEEAVSLVPGVTLLDLDDLKKQASENLNRRLELAAEAGRMTEEAAEEMTAWLLRSRVDPSIQSINKKCQVITEDVTAYLFGKLQLTEKEKRLVAKVVASGLQRMIREPVLKLKEARSRGQQDEYIRVIEELFDLKG